MGQVRASPSCRFGVHKPCFLQLIPWQAWGRGDEKEGPPPGSALDGPGVAVAGPLTPAPDL